MVYFYGSSLHLSGPAVGIAFGDDESYVAAGSAPEAPGLAPDRVAQPIVIQAMVELGAGDIFANGDSNL